MIDQIVVLSMGLLIGASVAMATLWFAVSFKYDNKKPMAIRKRMSEAEEKELMSDMESFTQEELDEIYEELK